MGGILGKAFTLECMKSGMGRWEGSRACAIRSDCQSSHEDSTVSTTLQIQLLPCQGMSVHCRAGWMIPSRCWSLLPWPRWEVSLRIVVMCARVSAPCVLVWRPEADARFFCYSYVLNFLRQSLSPNLELDGIQMAGRNPWEPPVPPVLRLQACTPKPDSSLHAGDADQHFIF